MILYPLLALAKGGNEQIRVIKTNPVMIYIYLEGSGQQRLGSGICCRFLKTFSS